MVRPSLSVRVVQNRLSGELQRAVRKELGRLVDDVAHEVEADWKGRVPVDTGAYRDSIHIEAPAELVRIVTTDVPGGDPYDIYNEYGTVDTTAQPSARPAAELHRQQFRAEGLAAIEKATR